MKVPSPSPAPLFNNLPITEVERAQSIARLYCIRTFGSCALTQTLRAKQFWRSHRRPAPTEEWLREWLFGAWEGRRWSMLSFTEFAELLEEAHAVGTGDIYSLSYLKLGALEGLRGSSSCRG